MVRRAAALVLLLAGCDAAPSSKPSTRATAAPATLHGTWRAQQPALFAGEGLRTETRDSRTTYHPDGRFDFSAQLAIFGDRLPPDGLPFTMTGAGRWRLANRILAERFITVTITPPVQNPLLSRLGKDMAEEVTARAESIADVVALEATRLVLRDRTDGTTATYARE